MLWAIRRGGEVAEDPLTDPAFVERLCVHEAGHVAVALALEGPSFVTAVRLSALGGATSIGEDGVDLGHVADHELRSRLAVAYGGLLAEQVVLGDGSLGSESDFGTATQLLERRVGAGLDARFPPINPGALRAESDELASRVSQAVIDGADTCAAVAARAVLANEGPIRRFAAALATARELTGEALQAAIADAGFVPIAEPPAPPDETPA